MRSVPARRSPFGEQKAKVRRSAAPPFPSPRHARRPAASRAWPKLSSPASTRACTEAGNFNKRKKLATVARSLPVRCAICSWVMWNSRESRSKARACSMGFRSARCRFSTMVISIACSSETWRRMAGMVVFAGQLRGAPAPFAGDELEAAAGQGRTSTGCTTPLAVMEAASSASCSSLTCERVWKGLRSIWSRGISRGLAALGFRLRARHAPAEAESPGLCPGRGVWCQVAVPFISKNPPSRRGSASRSNPGNDREPAN